MGGSASAFETGDSIVEPGKQSVLSDDLDINPQTLFKGIEDYVRQGKTKSSRESDFEITGGDGEPVLVKQVFQLPELLGGGTHTIHHIYHFNKDKLSVEHQFFTTPIHFERKTPNCTNKSVIHSIKDGAGSKVEFWQEAHEVRASGPMLRGMLEKVLSELGSQAKAHTDHPAIQDAGQLSVVTDPIEDSSVTADNYLDTFKTFLVDKMGATELPDGTIIEERSGHFDVFGLGVKSYAKHIIKKDENHVYCYEYGADESLSEMTGITHVQVHKNPFRLEQWNVQTAARRAGPDQQKTIKPFIESVVKFVQEG